MIIILLLLAVLSLFSFLKIELAEIISVQSKHQKVFDEKNIFHEKIHYTLEKKQPSKCLLASENPHVLSNIQWWKRNACMIKQSTKMIYYFYEDLKIDPCAIIDGELKAHYFKLTTLDSFLNINQILQTTFVHRARSNETCLTKEHHVKLGRQMLRSI